jgi:hypothetical protein
MTTEVSRSLGADAGSMAVIMGILTSSSAAWAELEMLKAVLNMKPIRITSPLVTAKIVATDTNDRFLISHSP